MTGGTHQNAVAVFGVDQDFGDALRVFQPDVGPVLTAIHRFINAITDGDAIARPRLAGADPYDLRVGGIDCHRTDRLHALVIEHGAEGAAAIDGLPYSAGGGSRIDGEPPIFNDSGDGGYAPAHGGRADGACRKAGDRGGVVAE